MTPNGKRASNGDVTLRRASGGGDARVVAPTLRQPAFVPGRVRELMADGLEAGMLLVQAPAGYGKTAVILQCLVDEGTDPHWYTCQPEDSEASSLLTGLTNALGAAETVGGQTALAALASRDAGESYGVALKPFFEELAEDRDEQGRDASPTDRGVLVIDDADAVRDSPRTIEILDDVLTRLAVYVRVVIISRAELPLASQAKRLLDGRAVRIVADDLLLLPDELAECARISYGVELSSEESDRLHQMTGGWGIALRLALRLHGLGTSMERDEGAPFTPEARSDLFAYLAAEVLSRIDERVERFLRQTAVLETLDPAVCARLTGEERAAELIQSLAGAGLPVMKAGWSAYRSHSLLRDYFLGALSENELREAHAAAGRAYTDIGEQAQALAHFVAAGDTEQALAIVDRHGRQLFFTRHGRAVLDLVKNAPLERLEEHYLAHYWAGFAAARMF
jgi:LuxR family maltose regulon positive regulatory protein